MTRVVGGGGGGGVGGIGRKSAAWLATVLIVCLFSIVSPAYSLVCPSMDIRNTPQKLNLLRDCTVIEGFLQVVLMDVVNGSATTTQTPRASAPSAATASAEGYSRSLRPIRYTDYDGLVFPKLREVTGHVIFFGVSKLRSLGQLFPNLSVIRGETLFMNFALSVFSMPDLQEISLTSLTTIVRGSVAIAKNPKLCYANTVNWDLIATGDHYLNLRNLVCHPCSKNCQTNNCWNQNICQAPLNNTFTCHSECLGGCWGPGPDQCNACKHFLMDGVCFHTCPENRYNYLNRHCVTRDSCLSMGKTLARLSKYLVAIGIQEKPWFTWDSKCINECPRGMEMIGPVPVCRRCSRPCPKVCPGAKIDSIEAAQNFRSCNIINGSLEIEIMSVNPQLIAEELRLALKDVIIINGVLTVSHSYPLVNLFFFENLVAINGNKSDNTFSLIVIDNDNLQALFDWNRPAGRNITIENGRILIHFNPNLCPQYIEDLTQVAKISNITDFVISKNANGVNYLCNMLNLTVDVQFKTQTSVFLLIKRPSFINATKNDWLRYLVYYKEAPYKNVTSQFNSDACNNDGWTINDVETTLPSDQGNAPETVSHLLARLKPDTQYAYFIKIYRPNYSGGHSEIFYVRTPPFRPSIPQDVQAFSNSSSEMIIRWRPPARPNGKLKKYVIRGSLINYNQEVGTNKNLCLSPLTYSDDTVIPPSFIRNSDDKKDVIRKVTSLSDTEKLCEKNSLKLSKSVSQFVYDGSIQSCEDILFSRIDEDVLKVRLRSSVPFPNDNNSFLSEEVSVFDESVESFDHDGSFKHFTKRYNTSTNFVTLTGLKHFSVYVIEVMACRKSVTEDEDFDDDIASAVKESANEQCSHSVMFTLRTQKSKFADIINSKLVTVKVMNKSVEIMWKKPSQYNGAIVSYNLQLKRSDHENAKAQEECITGERGHVEEKYLIKGLDFGHYMVRVRANSLAGVGPWSNWIQFYIVDESYTFYKAIMTIIISVTLILLSIALVGAKTLSYFYKKKSKENNKMYKTVNPEYSSVATGYVEDDWELSREDIQLVKEIRQGNFGMVYEGLLLPESRRVAVKTMIESASLRDQTEFLKEATIMKQFSKAHHVVKLIGIVSRGQPILVVMELMALGDLKTFLRNTRTWPQYPPPSPSHLIQMAGQIADGMVYLEAYKFVHRDLAARNCMVSEDLTVKIGDFGMTRDIYEKDYYRKGDKGLLPIRWMAPESLNDGVFTSASDVWSYGVVLWEMVTLASQPYQGMSNQQVLTYVVSGNKLETPMYCPPIIKEIMISCWKWKPKLRPTFVTIVGRLDPHLTNEFRSVSFYHSVEGHRARSYECPVGGVARDDQARSCDPSSKTDHGEHSLLLVPSSTTVEFFSTSRSSENSRPIM